MEIISAIPIIGPAIAVILSFIVALSVVVFVHEYGHYIVARWCGIHAEKFSIGFGRPIFQRRDKCGTLWQVAMIPLGGFVLFLGDADGASRPDAEKLKEIPDDMRHRSLHHAALWKRAATVAAGPVFNFIFSALVFTGLIFWVGKPSPEPVFGEIERVAGWENPVQTGDKLIAVNGTEITEFRELFTLSDQMDPAGPLTLRLERGGEEITLTAPHPTVTLVGRVMPFSAARRAGLQEGDFILAVDDEKMTTFSDLLRVVDGSEGRTLVMTILRGGEELRVDVTPLPFPVEHSDGSYETRYRIGVANMGIYSPQRLPVPPLEAAGRGVGQVWHVIDRTVSGVYHMIIGAISPTLLQGPVGIAQMSGETARMGALDFINFIAMISVAIGFLNLMPIPVLDGGHLVMFAYEAVRGKAPSEAAIRWIMPVGLALVLFMMLFATYNDIVRLVADWAS